MGWFDEQIRLRKKKDRDAFAQTFMRIAGAVTGSRKLLSDTDSGGRAQSAIDDILNFYHVKQTDIPAKLESLEDRLEYALHPSGIMYRTAATAS